MAGKIGLGIYRTLKWKAVRQKVFKRDNYRCVECGKYGRVECDHKIPIAKGGAVFDMKNLRTLCRGCHVQLSAAGNRKTVGPEIQAWQRFVNEMI